MVSIDVIGKAFGSSEKPVLLAGGQGTAYRVGSIVVKPAGNIEEAFWVAELFHTMPTTPEVRFPKPVRSVSGNWIEHGFVAWIFMEGEEMGEHYLEKLQASRVFHKALKDISEPAFASLDDSIYAVADRKVWQDTDLNYPEDFLASIKSMLSLVEPVDLPKQLIHGDLCGNIVIHSKLPPAIIDFSPYWRPTAFAEAVMLVDALAWDRSVKAGELFEIFSSILHIRQLSLRAVLRRIFIQFEHVSRGSRTREKALKEIEVYVKVWREIMKNI